MSAASSNNSSAHPKANGEVSKSQPAQKSLDFFDESNYAARILIVDDEKSNVEGLARLLKQTGYTNCIPMTSAAAAAEQFLEITPDLLLLDLHMEPVSGFDVLKRIEELLPPPERPPVIVLTADTTADAKHEALAAGATDFLAKPLDHVEVLLRINNLLTAHKLFRRCQIYSGGLERLVDKRTTELQRQTSDLEKALRELHETQRQVIQQERTRALATMACGIAHDLNNGLAVILGYGDILLRDEEKFPGGSDERRHLEEIVLAGSDNATLVERLREFYRPSDLREHNEVVDLNALVEQAIELTAPRWQSEADAAGGTIQIEKKLGQIGAICGAPAELREVLTNLIFNAVDAMPGGGTLAFQTSGSNGEVKLQVSDSGIGMSDDTLAKCLEPFFTTKGERGSGLGLAMSYSIIRRHKGKLEISSKINEGATFTITLPAHDPRKRIASTKSETVALQALRVLVVDDHPMIPEIISAYLAEDQHVVATAKSAQEAIEKFQQGPFDLVITDHAMPGANGQELATAIRQIKPGEPIILLTGFADLVSETDKQSSDVDLVLSKPASLDDLRKAIFEVMCHH
jgi:signal transduction histidine kinase